jgi:flagellar hook-associated protein 2
MDLGISGLASGFDWRTFVDKMVAAEQAPETQLRADQDTLNQRKVAYGSLATELTVLRNRLEQLIKPSFFGTRLVQSTDESVATAEAGSSTPLGQYTFSISQLATASRQEGKANLGGALSPLGDLSIQLGQAAFAKPIKAGTFTVNGRQVTIQTTDTLQQAFDAINVATGGAVTASYDATSDKITLSGSSPIVLGSATDTSNFLQVAKLGNNGTGTVTSTGMLGTLKIGDTLTNVGLATGTGEFKINGVTISYDAATDSVATVLSRINDSTAGVTATYDTLKDRLVLTSEVTGDIGISLEDVTGTFLQSAGLTEAGGGALKRGQDLLYTINNGEQLTSHSNTITEDSSSVTGLSVTGIKPGTVTISVGSDTETLKTELNNFIDQYNKVQSLIETQTASSTDSKGVVTAGVLANDGDADDIASQLRRIINTANPALSGIFTRLEDLGISSNGYDNKISLTDETKLDEALSTSLSAVQGLFADATNGLAAKLDAFLEKTVGEDGSLIKKQDTLTKQAGDIDTQIADLEKIIQADRDRMLSSFYALETTQARLNQQLAYLLKTFGNSSTSSSS